MRIRNYTRNPIQTVGLYGGALMDISSHGMDLTRALFGQEIVRARCLQIDGGPRCGGYTKDLRGDDTYAGDDVRPGRWHEGHPGSGVGAGIAGGPL